MIHSFPVYGSVSVGPLIFFHTVPVMQIPKCLMSLWKLSAELHAKVPETPHKETCTYNVLVSPCSCVCLCLCVCVHVCVTAAEKSVKEEKGQKGGPGFAFLLQHNNMRINPSVFCADGARSVFDHLCANPASISCSWLPLLWFAICCVRQLGTLFCLISITVHSFYSVTESCHGSTITCHTMWHVDCNNGRCWANSLDFSAFLQIMSK